MATKCTGFSWMDSRTRKKRMLVRKLVKFQKDCWTGYYYCISVNFLVLRMLRKKVTLGQVGGRVYGSSMVLQIFCDSEIIQNKEMPIPVDSVTLLFWVSSSDIFCSHTRAEMGECDCNTPVDGKVRKRPTGSSAGNPSVAQTWLWNGPASKDGGRSVFSDAGKSPRHIWIGKQ